MKRDLLKGLTVLVVDDEAELRDVLQDGLEMFGAAVMQAENGAHALEVLSKNKIDVILSDVRMPGTDGFYLLQEVRKIDPVLPPFFFLTGFSDMTPDEAIRKGAQGMLYKPVGPQGLAQTIANIKFEMARKSSAS